jgi:hypothetical protein
MGERGMKLERKAGREPCCSQDVRENAARLGGARDGGAELSQRRGHGGGCRRPA